MTTIHITPETSLKQIQDEFHQKFPFLKLVFFKTGHAAGEASSIDDVMPSNQTIREAGNFDGTAEFSIDGHTLVKNLEAGFQEHYGISVQVFRRSGTVWLMTSSTDSWSLAKQNETGKFDGSEVEVEVPDFREKD